MDWDHLASALAWGIGSVALAAVIVVVAMVWFLRHPKD